MKLSKTRYDFFFAVATPEGTWMELAAPRGTASERKKEMALNAFHAMLAKDKEAGDGDE